LYTIFINSLANFLRSKGHDLGIDNNGTLVIHLAFADDVGAPEPNPENIQRHLRLIEEWAKAWGHTIKVGEKKTASMYFPVPGAKPEPNPTPVITLASGTVVPWVETYKYLGCALTPKLDLSSALDLIINRVKLTAARLFGFNSITSRLDNASKAQLLKCAFSPYLLALVPPTKANIDKLQKELRKLARVITVLPSVFSDDGTVDLEGGIPTALYSIIRSRLTTLLALRLTPHQDAPAAAIIRTHVGQHGRTNVNSWVATTTKFLQHYSNMGAGPFDDIRAILGLNREPHLGDVTRAAQRQGLPANLTGVIESWLLNRTACVQVNGATTDPVPTAMGLGQGDAHAPILYTIFINSLANFLRSKGHDLGIDNNGTLVIHLAFADDVGAPEPNPENIQRHLRLIEEWAKAWGHTIKVGEKKTASMYFPVPGAKPEPNPTPVITLASGTVVPWVETYKYLGCALTPKLDLSSALDLIINRVKLTAARLFGFNSITSRLDNASKAQLLKCAFSPYLLALVPPTKANIDKLQKELRKLARVITVLPSVFSDDGTVDLEGGIPTALYSIIRSRLTTLLALRLTPHQDAPAAAIIRTHVGQHGRTNVNSWVATTTKFLQHYSNMGAGPFDDIRAILGLNREPHLGDVTRAAQVFARKACNASLREAFLEENGGGDVPIIGLSQRPPVGEGPVQQCHALAFSYVHYINLLGTLPFTPMSCRVTLGGGCPLPLTTAPLSEAQRGALAFIRLGAVALSASPLGVPAWRVTSTGKGARRNLSDPETWRLAKRGRQCPLCVGTAATADPFHVIHECMHPDVAAARDITRVKALRFVPILLAKMEQAAGSAGRFSQPPPAGGWKAPPNQLEAHSWETTTSGNLLLRLLAAAPWPAAAVDTEDAPLARHLGRCFDAARLSNTSLHAVYNSWCGFGSRASLALFAAYASAVTAAQQ